MNKAEWVPASKGSSDDDSDVDSDFETSKPDTKIDVDKIISLLMSPKVRNAAILSDLEEGTIMGLIDKARDIITSQPVFLELSAPVKIVSDIHG